MQQIDLRTTQNVIIEYELASLGERILAFFIDLVISVAVTIFISLMATLVMRTISSDITEYQAMQLFGILFLVVFLLYHFLSESLGAGQSWGKKAVGLKVVRIDGQDPSLSDYLLRAVFHLVDSIGSLGVLAAIFISSTQERRRLGDLTANTAVIRTKANDRFRLTDIMRISTRANYEPQYPQVKVFSEEDMLLIKTTLARANRYRNDAHRAALRELVVNVCQKLDMPIPQQPAEEFLKTLLRDYIVLTR